MKRLAYVLCLMLPACVSTPSAQPGSEREAVLSVVDQFLLADGNRDAAAMHAIVPPDAQLWVQPRGKDGDKPPRKLGFEALTPPAGGDPFIERYWDARVEIRGALAMVWAPYQLRQRGKLAQCGIDSFELAKIEGAWKVVGGLSTLEPDACAEFTPKDKAAMRPMTGLKDGP